ncbi:SNF2 family N-terminal domain-containing protein [Trichoderma chlorosporum]
MTASRAWSSQTPTFLPLEINLYSARSDAKEIGNILSRSVDTILDSLSYHVHQPEISVSPGIKIELLLHQKEAIDFIYRRETSQVPPERSLWKYNDKDAEKPFYQHVFTGAKRPEQIEAKGGIIADEMGLGKTLVILSTVASSLDRALSFVAVETQPVTSQSPKKDPSKATLIIAPSSLLVDSWVKEIHKHTYAGTLPFHKHLGPSRHREVNLLRERLVVFTTYATVAAEFRRGDTTLQKINWFRIVLDEAHDIRNCSTKQYKAVASLSAQHRWCLTGTPIQNSLEDLAALVSFLKVPILEKPQTFRKFITSPITSTSSSRFQNLQMLLQKIDMAVSGHRKSKIHSAVLESLLKLRLFCNNGPANAVLLTETTGLPVDLDEALAFLQQCDEDICSHCFKTIHFISNVADLLTLLSDVRQDLNNKSIIFSSWKKTLSLVSQLLRNHGIRHSMIDGSLNLVERRKVLEDFDTPTGANILLMTLGTGAVGLNLAVASRIYLLEPQWNPSIESQAIGRALRLGQTAQVVIVRYVMMHTVEESNVLSRQRRKLELAGGGFSKGKDMSSERFKALLDVFGVDQASVSG